MKIRVERDGLADAVAWVARSLPSRPSTMLRYSSPLCSRSYQSPLGAMAKAVTVLSISLPPRPSTMLRYNSPDCSKSYQSPLGARANAVTVPWSGGEVPDDGGAGGCPAQRGAGLCGRDVLVAGEQVGADFDGSVYRKQLASAFQPDPRLVDPVHHDAGQSGLGGDSPERLTVPVRVA